MHFCVLLLPFPLLLALLEGQSCLVLGGEEVEAHSLRCVQNLVDHLDFVSPPIAVLQLSPAHVKLQPVPSNILRAASSYRSPSAQSSSCQTPACTLQHTQGRLLLSQSFSSVQLMSNSSLYPPTYSGPPPTIAVLQL